jgi:hypothetical protein
MSSVLAQFSAPALKNNEGWVLEGLRMTANPPLDSKDIVWDYDALMV